jgi:PAS domain S-box-containing protein
MEEEVKEKEQLVKELKELRQKIRELEKSEPGPKKAEKTMPEGEGLLASIFTSIQDGISILDNDLNIIRINPAMEKWYAHARPLVGKKCYEAYHVQSGPCKVCPTIQTLKTGKPAYEVVAKKGTGGENVGWLDLYSFPLVDTETGKMKGVIEYVRDITERKKAAEERQKSEEAAGRLAQENAIVAEIGRIISSTLNIEEVYESFANEAQKLIPFDRIYKNLIDSK